MFSALLHYILLIVAFANAEHFDMHLVSLFAKTCCILHIGPYCYAWRTMWPIATDVVWSVGLSIGHIGELCKNS